MRHSMGPEANPIPVRQGSLTDATISPFKMASIAVYSEELFRHSLPRIFGGACAGAAWGLLSGSLMGPS
jgi:hypothetical protein